jgi:hypothetical protein
VPYLAINYMLLTNLLIALFYSLYKQEVRQIIAAY